MNHLLILPLLILPLLILPGRKLLLVSPQWCKCALLVHHVIVAGDAVYEQLCQ